MRQYFRDEPIVEYYTIPKNCAEKLLKKNILRGYFQNIVIEAEEYFNSNEMLETIWNEIN